MMPREPDAFPHEATISSGEQTSGGIEARIQFLLDQGPLAEAEELCKKATEQFPESNQLRMLSSEIREKEAAVRRSLEKGEAALGQQNFGVADEFFGEARGRLPLDGELADYIAEIIREHTQEVIGRDREAADTPEERKQQAEAVPTWRGELILLPKHPLTVSRTRAAARAF